MLKSIPFIKTDYFGLSVELGRCFKSPVTGRPTCQSPMDLDFWDPNLLFYPSGNLQRISGQLSVGTKIQLKYHTIGENESGRLTLTFRDSKNSIIHNIYSSDG
ncbi:MAG: hypothetical protein NT027_05415, partial [Proteobacteria bacterium]|nr:hypothetical protein [Pseudomonadota bacterium]